MLKLPTSVLTDSGGIVAGKSQILNNSNSPPSHYNPHPALVFEPSFLNEPFDLKEVDTALLNLIPNLLLGPIILWYHFLKPFMCFIPLSVV